MKNITTIKLNQETKIRLSRLKENERESFEEVIRKVLFILNRVRKDPVSANRLLTRIDKNIKRKRGYTNQEKEENQETKEKEKKKLSKQVPDLKQNPQQDKDSH